MLTIGMAHFDDYHGVYFTLQALRMYHGVKDCELVLVDNSPDTQHSVAVQDLLKHEEPGWKQIKYIPMGDYSSTTQTRQRIFDEAAGEWVLCMDCHVLLVRGALEHFRHYAEQHGPHVQQIISGPLWLDHLQYPITHFADQWRDHMWGVWGTAYTCGYCKQYQVECYQAKPYGPGKDGVTAWRTLEMGPQDLTECPTCQRPFPVAPWVGHEKPLGDQGYLPAAMDYVPENPSPKYSDVRIEIPGMGLGLFAAPKATWPGFHPGFRDFGGEEMYIHEKCRQQGGQVYCLPWLGWVHRFGRPGGAPYRISTESKARNYYLGLTELQLDVEVARAHFVDGVGVENTSGNGAISQKVWDQITSNPDSYEAPKEYAVKEITNAKRTYVDNTRPQPAEGLDIDEILNWCKQVPRDIDQHLETLKEWSAKCNHVTEFSERRESTIGLIAGRPAILVSYNTEANDQLLYEKGPLNAAIMMEQASKGLREYRRDMKESLDVPEIEPTDLLFLDTKHNSAHLQRELTVYGESVRRAIMLHDTELFGATGDDGGHGLHHGMKWWLENNSDWFVAFHDIRQYGLTVLSCHPQDWPDEPVYPWPKEFGPGTELKKILSSIGIEANAACDCNARVRDMDNWGVEGCKEQKDQIVAWMRDGQERWGWKDKWGAAAKLVAKDPLLALSLNPTDPFPKLIDASIKRAGEEETRQAELVEARRQRVFSKTV